MRTYILYNISPLQKSVITTQDQSTQKIYLKIEIKTNQKALRREAYDNFLKSEKKDNTKPKTKHSYSRREPHSPKMEKEENGRGEKGNI